MINGINSSVHQVADLDGNYLYAYQILARSNADLAQSMLRDRWLMQSMYGACEANIDQTKLTECMATSQSIINARLSNKPLVSWGVLFLAVGFRYYRCKASFSRVGRC